jgi:hypothetical protein
MAVKKSNEAYKLGTAEGTRMDQGKQDRKKDGNVDTF